MAAYSDLQQAEFASEKDGYTATRHQREVGTGYFDEIAQVVAEGKSSTTALAGIDGRVAVRAGRALAERRSRPKRASRERRLFPLPHGLAFPHADILFKTVWTSVISIAHAVETMRPSDIVMKFAIAFSFMLAGAVPIAQNFDGIARVLVGLERRGRNWPVAFMSDSQHLGSASLVVLSSVLVFSVGATLAIVGTGRALDYAQSSRRPRTVRS